MAREFIPHEYQKIAIDFMLDNPRCALSAGMGLGKTISALSVIDTLIATGTEDPVLVLGPLRVARDTWPKEIRKWGHLDYFVVQPIIGTVDQRLRALQSLAHVYTVNYDVLPWLVDQYRDKPWPFRVVIADESTRLKGYRTNQGGVRTRALARVARHTDRWINLTGTPAPNGLKDLWGQYWFLDFGKRLGNTYTGFSERWFSTDPYTLQVKPWPHAEREIYEMISDVTLAIRPEDWFDLEEPIVKPIRVYMPPNVRKQYRQLEKDLFTELACGTEIEVFNSASLTNKCLQFANGAVYTDAPKWAPVHNAKIEALESIVQEASGAPILVSYEFVSDRERILAHFKKAAVDISKPAGLDAFMKGQASIGVAHPKSMGHGIDGLQDVCNILVYFGHGWDLELRQQILERIGPVRQMQAGYKRPVWVYPIITDDTLDDTVLERHTQKRAVQDLLLEAMSRRNQ